MIAAAPTLSFADFELKIDAFQGGSSIGSLTIMDNGAGDADSTPGRILFTGTGTFLAANNIDALISAFSNRTMSLPISQLQDATISLQNMSNTPTRILIQVSDTGFTTPGSSGTKLIMSSKLGISSVGVGATTGIFQSFEDNGDVQFGHQNPTPAQIFAFPVPVPEEDLLLTRSGSYSLTSMFDLNMPANQILAAAFTGTTEMAVIPAPSNLLLLASVLPLLPLGLRFLRRQRGFPAA